MIRARQVVVIGIVFIAIYFLLMVFYGLARAHPPYDWVTKYDNKRGVNCCDKRDVKWIGCDAAARMRLGDVVTAHFPRDVDGQEVTISAIYQTEDINQHCLITKYGCLFTNVSF
jgi:hypothetical protein